MVFKTESEFVNCWNSVSDSISSGMPREGTEKVKYSELRGKEATLKLEMKNEKAMEVTYLWDNNAASWVALFDISISIVDISTLLKTIDIDMVIFENSDIDEAILENIDIDKAILKNIDIDKGIIKISI